MEKRALLLVVVILLVAGLSAAAAAGSGDTAVIRLPSDAAASERPWTCCDRQPCTKSAPPFCSCHDTLEQCHDACKECARVRDSDPPRYICKDIYVGDPAPRCHQDERNQALHRGPQEMAVVRGAKKGNGQERPWKCCDRAVPGPTTHAKVVWYCMDKVEHCTCKECMKLEGSHRYYCLDGYKGSDPGPSCTHA
ncbi:hypothetical protein GQ55_5G461800 [Panicum hallii var. hallii]|uniref:Bowman-Birk serine protease inhibitors family domain-containing protein n=1 Tax=Panicum hallii var. hallii TaxID=1504633 RepID=A0A2T7DQI2_9POAL|nr:hypothetical protein GQ55_5G461800 [Panicum hallii var. hallii]